MTYLRSLAAQIANSVGPDSTSSSDHAEALFLIYAVLARSKGTSTDARDVHDAWVAWMLIRGADHPSMVPFDELAPEVQQQDAPFVAAILQASRPPDAT